LKEPEPDDPERGRQAFLFSTEEKEMNEMTKARRYSELGDEEDRVQEEEYAVRLLKDMLYVIGDQKQITTQESITKFRQIQTSPWRRFRGDGLKDGIEGAMVVAGLLSRFGVKSSTIRIAAKNVGTGSTAKGYKRGALQNALAGIDGSVPSKEAA
jgi:uncharacterized protein DUF3631